MRIVQLANFVTPTSGGIRTTLDALGLGYVDAGVDRHLIVPGPRTERKRGADGTTWRLDGPVLPGSGGYRMLVHRRRVRRLLDALSPDRVEVSDRWTLAWVGDWAARRKVPSTVLAHEHLTDNLETWLPHPVAVPVGERADRRLPDRFDRVVCASDYTASSFGDAPNVTVVPLGVDLQMFRPVPVRRAAGAPARLLLLGRLSREKRPELAFAALRELRAHGHEVELHVVGDGPLATSLRHHWNGHPVRFWGHVADRVHLARMLAAADVVLCPCPTEGFGLAALEALACGTPVVGTGGGVAGILGIDPGAVGPVGAIAPPDCAAVARAIAQVLDHDASAGRAAARARAERFPWSLTVSSMLEVHDVRPQQPAGVRAA